MDLGGEISVYNLVKMKQYSYLLLPVLLLGSCAVTSNRSSAFSKGSATEFQSLNPSEKGPILFQKIVSADWAVERGGLINLKDPKAIAAGLQPGKEPIQLTFYVLDHPKLGRYIIDTGMSDVFRKDVKEWPLSGFVTSQLNLQDLKIHTTVKDWITKSPTKIEAVFLTHLHMDHIFGTPDFPAGTTLIVGPNEANDTRFINLFVQGSTDKILGENAKISELNFGDPSEGKKAKILDYFGDQSLYVIHSPGHTVGSLAFLIKTPTGSHLILGDSCHTKWGWENNVTPGDFTKDQDANRESLDFLKQIASKYPKIQVHPGHQSLR